MADVTLPKDEFTVARRALQHNPGSFGCGSTVHVQDDYGNLVTWVVETFRVDGRDTILLQWNTADGGRRLVLPPPIAATLANHRDRVTARTRRAGARQAVETKRAKGKPIGNPEALKQARRARKAVR